MSISHPTLKDYRTTHQDRSMWIGHLGWYSQRAATIPKADLVRLLTSLDLAQFIPRDRSAPDTFRKAAKKAECRHKLDAGTWANVLVRDVVDDNERIVKRLILEVRDQSNERLSYDEVFELVFNRDSETSAARKLQPNGAPSADAMAVAEMAKRQAQAAFGSLAGEFDEAKLRSMFNAIIGTTRAVTVRQTGSVLFFPANTTETVEKLEELSQRIPGAEFVSVPLIDDPKRRTMVTEAVTEQCVTQADDLIVRLRELKELDRVPVRAFSTIRAETQEIETTLGLYADLLGDKLSAAGDKLVVLRSLVGNVAARAA